MLPAFSRSILQLPVGSRVGVLGFGRILHWAALPNDKHVNHGSILFLLLQVQHTIGTKHDW